MTPAEERLAEALAVERMHGERAGDFIMERLRTLAAAGDMAGVARWTEIGEWLIRLRQPEGPTN